jgi:predicted amidohydrolase
LYNAHINQVDTYNNGVSMTTNDISGLPEKLTVGLLQIKSLPGSSDANIDANIAEMSRLIDVAAAGGAELVILPEYWPFGFQTFKRLNEIAEPVPGGHLSTFLIEAARQYKLYLAGGTICERGKDGHLYNTNLFISPQGLILSKHSKANLYSQLGEDTIFKAGGEFSVSKTDFGNVGVMICYEGDFPETPRALKLMGAHILLHVAAYESPLENWWQTLYDAHALTNATWLIQVGLVGNFEWMGSEVHSFGMSRVIAPTGEVIASATHYPAGTPFEQMKSEVKVVTLDYRRMLEIARANQECLTIDRRPDLYGALVQPKMQSHLE